MYSSLANNQRSVYSLLASIAEDAEAHQRDGDLGPAGSVRGNDRVQPQDMFEVNAFFGNFP